MSDDERPAMRTSIEKIIAAAVERGASDLHIKAGDVFRARINGRSRATRFGHRGK